MQRYPNESESYREARAELLKAEDALRSQLERVAELRRRLPLGGKVREDYMFDTIGTDGRSATVRLSDLFSDGKDSLLIYGFMYGPNMPAACPMCTSFLDSLDGSAPHITQRMNLAVCARSRIERIADHAKQRGWSNLRLISSANNNYSSDYATETPDGSQLPIANVFVRRNGTIHHFWSSELFFGPSSAGHPRHVDLLWPLWNVLDLTPEGRGDFFPSLDYGSKS